MSEIFHHGQERPSPEAIQALARDQQIAEVHFAGTGAERERYLSIGWLADQPNQGLAPEVARTLVSVALAGGEEVTLVTQLHASATQKDLLHLFEISGEPDARRMSVFMATKGAAQEWQPINYVDNETLGYGNMQMTELARRLFLWSAQSVVGSTVNLPHERVEFSEYPQQLELTSIRASIRGVAPKDPGELLQDFEIERLHKMRHDALWQNQDALDVRPKPERRRLRNLFKRPKT